MLGQPKRFHTKKVRKEKPKTVYPMGTVFGIALGVFIVMTFIGLELASHVLVPTLTSLAQFQAKQALTYGLNYALSDVSLADLSTKGFLITGDTKSQSHTDFFITHSNNQGKLSLVSYDTPKVDAFLHEKTQRLIDFLQTIDSGKITINSNTDQPITVHQHPSGHTTTLPLGLLTKTALFGNMGPHIPIRFDFLSDLTTHVVSKVKTTDINTVYLTLYIHVDANVRLIFPFQTGKTTVVKDIPVAEIAFQGEIPKYYNSNKGN
jgi:sporulation protein YunB